MDHKLQKLMYLTVILIGASQTIMLSTSNNMINEMIGLKSKNAAIVFGLYSFFDKISNGLIIYFAMVPTRPKSQLTNFRTHNISVTCSRVIMRMETRMYSS